MYFVLLVIHVIVCHSLILIVLLQAGKGSGLSGLFGMGASDQMLNAPTGMATVKKVTSVMAIVFMITSLSLTILTSRKGISTVTRQFPSAPVAPAAPVAPVAPPSDAAQ